MFECITDSYYCYPCRDAGTCAKTKEDCERLCPNDKGCLAAIPKFAEERAKAESLASSAANQFGAVHAWLMIATFLWIKI